MLGEFSLKSAQQKQQQKKNPELISLLFKTSPFFWLMKSAVLTVKYMALPLND